MYINLNTYSKEAKVYRTTSLERIIDLLVNKKLTLVKPILWDDPLENLLWNQSYQTLDGRTVDFSALREGVFGQCWTFNEEKDFSWRVYAPDKNGVKIETTVEKLHDSINNQIR